MDFLEVIEKRHSVRKYADKPVEREILDAIVKVAQTAPSSRNSKSSAYMIIEDRDTLDALSQMRDYGSALLAGAQAAIAKMLDAINREEWSIQQVMDGNKAKMHWRRRLDRSKCTRVDVL